MLTPEYKSNTATKVKPVKTVAPQETPEETTEETTEEIQQAPKFPEFISTCPLYEASSGIRFKTGVPTKVFVVTGWIESQVEAGLLKQV